MKSAGKNVLSCLVLLGCLQPACIPFDEAGVAFCEKADAARQQAICDGSFGGQAPSVVSLGPDKNDVDAIEPVFVTFSKPMRADSLNPPTFTLRRGQTPVPGVVSLEGATARFTPVGGRLALLGQYSARVTVDAKDLTGISLADSREWTFSVRDGAWAATPSLELGEPGGAGAPRLAVNASGHAVAVWTRTDGSRDDLWASNYTPGKGWSKPQLIEINNTGSVREPSVDMDGTGNAHVVWAQHDGSVFNLWGTRYVAGAGWVSPRLIEEVNLGDALSPHVRVSSSGNTVVVWRQSDGTRFNIWSRLYAPDVVGWRAPLLVETHDAEASEPRVALGEDGNAIAVWLQRRSTQLDVLASTLAARDTAWATAEPIEFESQGDADAPQVALDGSGNALVVWRQAEGSVQHVWANRYVPGTRWGSSQRLDGPNGTAARPSLSVSPGGEGLVLWSSTEGAQTYIGANRYVPGTGWGTASRVSAQDAGPATFPLVAVDSVGNALGVWQQEFEGRQLIASSRYLPSKGWGTPERLQGLPEGSASPPALGMDASGVVTLVWSHQNGTTSSIWSRRRE
jgi:hypothetical protein